MSKAAKDRKDHEESIALAPQLSYDAATGQLSYTLPSPPPNFTFKKVEVQVAGPLKLREPLISATESKYEEKKGSMCDGEEGKKKWIRFPYQVNYQVNSTSWPFFTDKLKGNGVYRLRAKAQFLDLLRPDFKVRLFWGPYSDELYVRYEGECIGSNFFKWDNGQHRLHLRSCLPLLPDVLVNMIGSYVPPPEPLEWDVKKTRQMMVGLDEQGNASVARYVGTGRSMTNRYYQREAILSRGALNPFPSSSSSSSPRPSRSSFGVVRFDVRVDYLAHKGLAIGVRHKETGFTYSRNQESLVYHCTGYVLSRSQVLRYGQEYGTGDIIGVQVDFAARTVSFFNNNEMKVIVEVRPACGIDIDLSRPLYACFSTTHPNEQVTLLN